MVIISRRLNLGNIILAAFAVEEGRKMHECQRQPMDFLLIPVKLEPVFSARDHLEYT